MEGNRNDVNLEESADDLPRRHRRDHVVPRRRLTLWGTAYVLVFFALPVMALALALDYGLYRAAKAGLAPCVSIFCLGD